MAGPHGTGLFRWHAGQEAWDASSHDLNIGDIGCELESDKNLSTIMAALGMFDVKIIWTMGSVECIPFDNVLVDAEFRNLKA